MCSSDLAEQEEEGFVNLTESIDDYEVFNQPSPPQDVPEDMGIQKKPQRSLQELMAHYVQWAGKQN